MRDLKLKRVGLGTEESSLHTKKSIQKYHSFTITDLEGAREEPQVHTSSRPLQPKQVMHLPPGNCAVRPGAEAARGYSRAGGKHPDAGGPVPRHHPSSLTSWPGVEKAQQGFWERVGEGHGPSCLQLACPLVWKGKGR